MMMSMHFCRGILVGFVVSVVGLASANTWTFVVAGDGRTNDATPDLSGINTAVMTKLVAAIKTENPRFVLYTGDLIHGVYGKITAPVGSQLESWKQVMSSLTGASILPVRGNHETYGDPDGKVWLKKIKPLIDAAHVDYFKGEKGFSYSYSPAQSGLVVIAADQFIHEHRVNLPELENALHRAKSAGAKSIVVFAHEMAFTCCSHGDNENMAKFKADRDAFLELLELYGVKYFFAGHDHTYDWMQIKSPKWKPDFVINQVVAGTAGAPFYKDKGYYGDHDGYDLSRKEHMNDTYGYLLVQVSDDGTLNVTFKPLQP